MILPLELKFQLSQFKMESSILTKNTRFSFKTRQEIVLRVSASDKLKYGKNQSVFSERT